MSRLADWPIHFVLGGHHPEIVEGADLLFISPGVPEANPVRESALAASVPVCSMTTLFFDLCPGVIVGITGSSGKTTTTELIGHILRTARCDVVVGGNTGEPMLELLPHVGRDTLVVIELSSFQLSLLRRSPHIAVVTNISPNHLDRHGAMDDYIAAKRHIVFHQGSADFAVLNSGDVESPGFASATAAATRWFGNSIRHADGAEIREQAVGLCRQGRFVPVIPVKHVPLLGAHNLENILAALATTALLGVEPEAMAEAIRTFRPPAHRLQTVAEHGGVRFVDDSIATSPARAAVALQAIPDPVLLIAGGRDKNLPWDDFARLVALRARTLFLIGEAAPLIEDAVRSHLSEPSRRLGANDIHRCATLSDAVLSAAAIARPGEVVLLSPGCTSYDMFTDFAERGDTFARAVEALLAA
jgi:UDP-N-acetylmuramoylalanine--D-glutamate ligase